MSRDLTSSRNDRIVGYGCTGCFASIYRLPNFTGATAPPAQSARRGGSAGTFFQDGVETDRIWANRPQNFDNLANSLMSLLITLTLDGYLFIMFPCMAIVGEGKQPRTAANPQAFFYFFAYISVCVFAIMQMLIGIVFYHYSRVRRAACNSLSTAQLAILCLPRSLQFSVYRAACICLSTAQLAILCLPRSL